MWDEKLLKIRVSLKGRPVKAYIFNQDSVLIGRSPEADVFLDNAGISRDHLKIERTSGGYFVEDLNSANGTFVNDQPVRKQYLNHEDVIRIGKFSLWVSFEEDRRGGTRRAQSAPPAAFEGTTVLSTNELEEMMKSARAAEPEPPAEAPPQPTKPSPQSLSRRGRAFVAAAFLSAVIIGSAIGAAATWYLGR